MADDSDGSNKPPETASKGGAGITLKRLKEMAEGRPAASELKNLAYKFAALGEQQLDWSKTMAAAALPNDLFAGIRAQDELLRSMTAPLSLGPVSISPPEIPQIHMPPNPIHETNSRLERIEQRFEEIQEVAVNGAKIATALQAYAAELLTKFEKAAAETDRSARTAVRIGVVAIIIAILTFGGQILYTELYRGPVDTATNKALVEDLVQRIDTGLGKSDAESAAVLKEIRDLLAAGRKPN